MTCLRHIGIFVDNLETMTDFYSELFDMKKIYGQIERGEYLSRLVSLENAEFEIVKLKNEDGLIIELLKNHSNLRDNSQRSLWSKGLSHLAITVDNIDNLCGRLANMGACINTAPMASPLAPVKVCFCKDPEGNFLELVQDM